MPLVEISSEQYYDLIDAFREYTMRSELWLI